MDLYIDCELDLSDLDVYDRKDVQRELSPYNSSYDVKLEKNKVWDMLIDAVKAKDDELILDAIERIEDFDGVYGCITP